MAKGYIVIDAERCKGCTLCQDACLFKIIDTAEDINTKGYHPVLLQDPHQKCTGCGLCAVVCPDACISVYQYVPARQHMATV